MKKNLLKILYNSYAFFARIYVKRTKPEIIGITGSVGKTSCRMIIFQILQKYLPEKKVYSSPKNYNSELGLVMSIFGIENYTPGFKNLLKLFFCFGFKSIFMKKNADILVLEYGVDNPGDMDFLLKIAKPDYAIFTKLDYIHSANFDSKQAIGEEKSKLLKVAKKKIFLNYFDDFIREYSVNFEQEKYFYGNENIDYSYDLKDSQIIVKLNLEGKIIETNMLGEENFVYINLAFKILALFKGEEEIIENSFLKLENLPGRFRVFEGKYESVLIDSSYNAGFESMKKMIENTVSLKNKIFVDKKILFVLGDMRETGENSEMLHKQIFEFAKNKGEIISVGKETSAYFGKHLGNFKYSSQAGLFLKDYLKKSKESYIVLFKGSQNTIFLEEAIKEVLKNKKDTQDLVRQEKYWKKIKENY